MASPAASDPRRVFQRQKEACRAAAAPGYRRRREILQALENLILTHQDAIAEAISLDFGNRSVRETKLMEVFPAVSGLSHARRNLKKWMKPQRRRVSLWFAGAANRVIPQPKGIVGIVSPWNYPLLLAVSPLTSAVAAGNRCMIKMASHSQRLCRLMGQLVSSLIPEDELAILPVCRRGISLPWRSITWCSPVLPVPDRLSWKPQRPI